MASSTNPPQKLTDRKRHAIVAAAIAAFRSQGFESTSMDKIAADAGVSKRTVYNHFPSKDELFAEILMQLWESSSAQLEQPYRPELRLRSQLIELMLQKVRTLSDQNFLDLARVAIAETIHSPERARAVVARMGEREEGVTAWIRAAQADGRLRAGDPVFASHCLQSQIKGFAFWPQVTLGKPPLAQEQQLPVVEAAVDMFLGYFGVANGAPG